MIIFFDLDQTLGQFMEHSEDSLRKLLGTTSLSSKMSSTEFSEKFNKLKHNIPKVPNFWETIPVIPGATKMVQFAQEKFGKSNVKILSAYAEWDKRSIVAKPRWAQRHFGIPENQVIVCKRHEKQEYSGPSKVLVDDYIKNIVEWKKAGGLGIHYRSPSQVIGDLKDLGSGNHKYN